MARVIPPKLAHWIEQHKTVVQPYALNALVDLWFELTNTVTVTFPKVGPASITTTQTVGEGGTSGGNSEAPK